MCGGSPHLDVNALACVTFIDGMEDLLIATRSISDDCPVIQPLSALSSPNDFFASGNPE